MDPKLRRKLIVSGTGLVVIIGLLVVVYILYLRTFVKQWTEARDEIRSREKRLEELRSAFANQRDPQSEIRVLEQEIANLKKANERLEKVKTEGVETNSLPEDLDDPDPAIRRELYRDYMKQVMDVAENNVKERLKSAKISPPDIDLYEELKDADEVAYYMNRAGGLQGVVDALAGSRASGGFLTVDQIALENYEEGKKRREGAVNIMSYLLKMTMDTQTFLYFLYNLHEENSYYFIDEVKIKPRGSSRGSDRQLDIEARVNTTMVFTSQVQAQVKAAVASATRAASDEGGGGGWMSALAKQMKKQVEEEKKAAQEKKWYQFWKWFKK